MKSILLASAMFLLPVALYAADTDQTPAPASSQVEVNEKFCSDMESHRTKLNALYNRIAKQYAFDKIFLKYLEQSQKAWLAYFDAQINTIYPREYHDAYGTMITACECSEKARLIDERIKELNQWVEGVDGNKTCPGTRPQKQ